MTENFTIEPHPDDVLNLAIDQRDKAIADLAALAAERDGMAKLLGVYERITKSWTRGMYSARIDCVRGDVKAAVECLSEGLDGYDGTEWDGTETGAEWWERTKAEEGIASWGASTEPPAPGPEPVPAGTDRTAATTETGQGAESVSEPQTTSGGGEWVPVLSVLENVHLHALIAVSGEPLKVRIVNGTGGGSVDMTFAQWTAFASTIGEELVKLLPAPALAQLSTSRAHRSGSDWPDRGAAENAL